ncbi:hypothetical protein [Belnapia rosea]|uniref:hypothetical protein n=1 Tax=Belnapia rosea TaxID=938405 RepID=UPI0038D0DC71
MDIVLAGAGNDRIEGREGVDLFRFGVGLSGYLYPHLCQAPAPFLGNAALPEASPCGRAARRDRARRHLPADCRGFHPGLRFNPSGGQACG